MKRRRSVLVRSRRGAALGLVCAMLALVPAATATTADGEPNDGHRQGTDTTGHPDHDATVRHGFGDVELWVERFDDPARDAWQRPDEVIRFLDLPQDAVVADIGAGTGYFAVRLARAVGSGGRVLAVDVEPEMVEYMTERAKREALPRMEPVLAAPDDPRLPDGEVDRILLVNTWHHIDRRIDYLSRLRRALAPDGTVVVVDYRAGDLPVGPPPGHKLSEHDVREEFAEAGWTLARTSSALPYQYVLEFRP